jgi:crossover junction endodeoxyribonuclease RusA
MQTFELPFPPSLNNCFSQGLVGGRVRRFPSKRYRAWRREAAALLGIKKFKSLTGPVIVHIDLTQPDKRRRDVDNFIKPLLDAIVSAGVLYDDSQVVRVTSAWADGKVGARIHVTEQEKPLAQER